METTAKSAAKAAMTTLCFLFILAFYRGFPKCRIERRACNSVEHWIRNWPVFPWITRRALPRKLVGMNILAGDCIEFDLHRKQTAGIEPRAGLVYRHYSRPALTTPGLP
jgi:hypothetical protein